MTELLQDYDYVLPPDAIAQVPVTPRDSAKMLDCSDRILQDRQVCDLPDILRPGDLVIVNDTRVLRAQLTVLSLVAALEAPLAEVLAAEAALFAGPAAVAAVPGVA